MIDWAMRWSLAVGLVALGLTSALIAGDLPKQESGDDDSFEVEPPLLIPYRSPDVNSKAAVDAAKANGNPSAPYDVERLERDVERAKRGAAGAERLYRIGAISKVEAEQRALKVVRLQSELENARLVLAKAEAAAHEEAKSAGTTPKEDAAPVDANLAHAIEAAHAAAKKREAAEIAEAEVNLARQQKLLMLGYGRKSEVAKAERKLAELKAAKN
jgi:hypothetical protein